ncbi:aromatase/cyclase [Rhodococcus sp. H29-C3]|uniref:aromatase/cyclase n=1 Tax=Rhodococcus sp. H29-C3 TaxID=3046307 RepID=UPI0024BA3FA2|nr:aromatase/cyclase [Rhodococcus sp. H29-C3]MDJ0362463.1 aromatase/cyclase [Rhodococcus sp. H29-C3]
MSDQITHRNVEHSIEVDAEAEAVYELIEDVNKWPQIFPPTIHAQRLSRSGNIEFIEIWATAVGEVRHWTSQRQIDSAGLRISFRQMPRHDSGVNMGGSWVIKPLSTGRSLVTLLHDYSTADSSNLAWLDQSVDENSKSELSSLKKNVEQNIARSDCLFSFEDSVDVTGDASSLFDFIYDAGSWPERLPHVAAVKLDEPSEGVQSLEMETRSHDGSVHTTKSYRVQVNGRIAYKQYTLPALLELHTGVWSFTEKDGFVEAKSQHTVILNKDAIQSTLGKSANIYSAKDYVRKALGTNSLATLNLAKQHVETFSSIEGAS